MTAAGTYLVTSVFAKINHCIGDWQSDRAKILESDLVYMLEKMIRMSR